MALPNIFSRRKRLENKVADDVYQYETISPKLRNQILFILDEWNTAFAFEEWSDPAPINKACTELMRKELGAPVLTNKFFSDEADEFRHWFREWQNIDDLIDAIEIAVRIGAWHAANTHNEGAKRTYKKGLAELNARMLEAGLGFQFENGQAVQVSSTLMHREAVIPALSLLASNEFSSANAEFRDAFREFNAGNYDDSIHDCCNAFESVLKVILTKKGWPFDPEKDTAGKLISTAFTNGLIPQHMQTEFAGLRTILESGVPTVRNKTGGHGAGANPRKIPKHIAAFQLHQTAAAILLLVNAANPKL